MGGGYDTDVGKGYTKDDIAALMGFAGSIVEATYRTSGKYSTQQEGRILMHIAGTSTHE
jgi:hypothetical protein